MKTKQFHISNLGSFSGGLVADTQGFVTIHDSQRYDSASDDQLTEWSENGRSLAIRNAAQAELNERQLQQWRKGK
jgi:hypothetical protein